MAIPTLITLKATIRDSVGPVAGRMVFARHVAVRPASGSDEEYPIPEEIVVSIGADGILELPIPATDDPAFSPTGWTWEVRTYFPHWRGIFFIQVPYNSPDGELRLSQIAPEPEDGTGDLYALVNHTHSGGGGGGSVDSVFGRTGDVTAQNGDYTKGQVGLGNVDNTADSAKAFAASQITSGTFAIGRIPTGTTGSTVALGNAAPNAHAASHTDGGSDEISVDASQVTGGTLAIGRVPTGTSGSTVALGNAPAAAVATHEAASDPHPRYAAIYYSTGSGYSLANAASIYVGPDDPGAVADGSVWIDTDA